jgi:hypothetical protein
MGITNEIRAKIFALYLRCEIMNVDQKEILIGICGDMIYSDWRGLKNVCGIDETQLLLTPLSKITDEDKIEVAKMAGYDPKLYSIEYSQDTFSFCCSSSSSYIELKYLQFGVVDYLRSKSYHIPYQDIDLFEAGIAIEKQ